MYDQLLKLYLHSYRACLLVLGDIFPIGQAIAIIQAAYSFGFRYPRLNQYRLWVAAEDP
jgi:hypothetical protein